MQLEAGQKSNVGVEKQDLIIDQRQKFNCCQKSHFWLAWYCAMYISLLTQSLLFILTSKQVELSSSISRHYRQQGIPSFSLSFVFSKAVLPPHGQIGLHNILLQPSSTWWRGRAPGGSRAGLEKLFFTWFMFTQFESLAHVLMPVFANRMSESYLSEASWSLFCACHTLCM